MFRRCGGLQPPAHTGGVIGSRDETSGRRAEADSRESRYPLEKDCSTGWGWYHGELICPLSWLLLPGRSHGQRPEEPCDEA
jgi:hypothetical protein